MQSNMTVTVVICTWNRSTLLRRTLAALEKLEVPVSLHWDLLVVDNASTDDTASVVESFVGRLPVRRVVESRQGLSHARNRALSEASGELLLWTDDDVLVAEEWISAHVAAAERFPDAPFFGGTVDPWFERSPPRWIARNLDQLRGAYAIRQLGDDVRPLRPGEMPFGANMAMRRSAIRGMRFDTALGRSGEELLSGEETEFLRRLQADSGRSGVWVADARVRHFIPAERLSASYLRRYYEGLGLSAGSRADPEGRTVLGVPPWTWREYVERTAVYLARWPVKDEPWVEAFRRRAWLAGYIRGRRSTSTSAT